MTKYDNSVSAEEVIANVFCSHYYKRSNVAVNFENLEKIIKYLKNFDFPVVCEDFSPATLDAIAGRKTFEGIENPFVYKDGILILNDGVKLNCGRINSRLPLLTSRIVSQGIEMYLKSITPKALRYE